MTSASLREDDELTTMGLLAALGSAPDGGSVEQFGNRPAHGGDGERPARLVVRDAHTGRPVAEIPDSTPADVAAVVAAAVKAQPDWSEVPPLARGRVMAKVRAAMDSHLDLLADLICLENGKLRSEALAEIDRALEVLDFTTAIGFHLRGDAYAAVGHDTDLMTFRYPVGVIAAVTPFNFPMMVPMWLVPMALACGNAVVLKPSEKTPLTALALHEIFTAAGVPDGVLSVVHGGPGTVDALITHADVDAVSFVGSAPVAEHVWKTGTGAGKRVQALAGAKNHLVVLDDADIDSTADAIYSSAFGSAGQRCMAGSVLLAERGAFSAVVAALNARIVGAVEHNGPHAGVPPVISEAAGARIATAVADALTSGCEILSPPAPLAGRDIPPTIVHCVDARHPMLRDELFGPVLAAMEVADLDAALEIVNASPYGNAASIFTSSAARARRFSRGADVGMVGVNVGVPVPIALVPFSGWKGSFYGDLHVNGLDGLRFCTRQRAVTARWATA
jgi:malonate-semialdehyde dehydrogenase (acetylating)/methylmalonate-semialdehyde dehydrogenase